MSERFYVEHVTAPGEDIFFLAEYYYGNAARWTIIYHENLETIGDDPETLREGTKLRIPMLATSEEKGSMPTPAPGTEADAHFDPLVVLAADRYGDMSMYFDILERNGYGGDEVVAPGTALRFPGQGEKHNLALALRWREKFGYVREYPS